MAASLGLGLDTIHAVSDFSGWVEDPSRIHNLYVWHVGMLATGVLWLANTLDCP